MRDPASQVDLHARGSRERLAKMVVSLLEHWALPLNDQASLLGLSAHSRSTIARYRRGEPLADNADLLARAGHLLGIHKALRILFPHDRELDPFDGSCPFHGDCFEGLACGPAIEKRLGRAGATIAEEDPFWDLEAEYIALALTNYIVVLSPTKIILGGGVMQREFLFPKIRRNVQSLLNGYVVSKSLVEGINNYIVPPGLGNQSGSLGAIALAMQLEEINDDPRI